MKRRYRLLLALVMYLALVGGVACIAYSMLAVFYGRMAIGLGREEDIAVDPMDKILFQTPGLLRDVEIGQIPFKNPEAASEVFSKWERYAVLQIPFSVKIDKINVISAPPPKHKLRLTDLGSRSMVEIEEGGQTHIDGQPYTVKSIEPWSGLIRHRPGMPMAAVTLYSNTGGERTTLFLESGVWQTAPHGVAIHFERFPVESWARDAAADNRAPGIESARWGVVDRGAINWFNSFAPGTGARLSTGEEVTLVAFDENRPAVAVEIAHDGEKRVVRVSANEQVEGSPVRFEYPALAPRVFMVRAWEDGRALVSAFENGQPTGQADLQAGQSFGSLRLDDVQSSAVVATAAESKLWAAVLQSESGEETVLRQGESKTFGDLRVEYSRVIPPRKIAYELTIAGWSTRTVSLEPGDWFHSGDWFLRQAQHDCDPNTIAVLKVEYVPGLTLGNTLLVVGMVALLLRIVALLLRIAHRAMRSKRRTNT